MRTAIDRYKDAVDLGVIGGTEIDPENQGYPPEPRDAGRGRGAGRRERGERAALPAAHSDRPADEGAPTGACGRTRTIRTQTRWGGDNVYDVYTKSRGTALDGTRYRDW